VVTKIAALSYCVKNYAMPCASSHHPGFRIRALGCENVPAFQLEEGSRLEQVPVASIDLRETAVARMDQVQGARRAQIDGFKHIAF